ncbi:methyltransferase domain-containing protein [uncultured Psychroserpens sp.]|uniref:methyltransferase domain-containing protein n=1 Tax=uncultured Psychroserpens sp. TaxID=255436 RepID=UPI0026107BF8|nr:methyltransferase domain-containing protein [uncultured Psychroserpens sp.]
MNQIYEQHLWGGATFDFYSGQGSHDPKIITPYINAITTFFESHHNTLSVCDLGCGDFNIGKHLTKYTKKYIAVDIVDNLITRNKAKFIEDHLEFHCLDITKDKLPIADCILLRQVLQHLSNKEILSIVHKLRQYKYVILTEHIPTGSFLPNKDIISGQGIRLKHNSGVDLLNSPFNLKILETSVLNKVVLHEKKGQIVTTLFTL